jgi:hypothetical protein
MLGQTHAISIASGSGRINCLSSVGVVAVQGKLEIAAACGLQALLLLLVSCLQKDPVTTETSFCSLCRTGSTCAPYMLKGHH